MNHTPTSKGFTLIELMITIAVMAVLLAIAIPSFTEFRQRAALRGAADQVVTFWGDARFEALRRNQFVKVGFSTSGADYCLGAATTSSAGDNASCDCSIAINVNKLLNACDVSRFPSDQTEWRGIIVDTTATTGTTLVPARVLGDDDGGVIVIDPKRGNITQTGDVGRIFLRTPESTNANYRLNIIFDRNGRAIICEPAAAPNTLPQFTNRRC